MMSGHFDLHHHNYHFHQTVLLAKDGFPYLDCVHLSLNLSKAYIKKKLFFDSVIQRNYSVTL